MTRTKRRLFDLFLFLCAALLAGCAGIAPEGGLALPSRHALESFLLEGRFSLRQGEQSHSGRLDWRHSADGDELLLASPFGQGIAEIVAVDGWATLATADGRRFTATDVASLTGQALGFRLPLDRLADWVRARVADADVLARDAQGRPLRLRADDWRIEYGYDGGAAEALPASVFAGREGAFELRLRIDRWSVAGERGVSAK